VLAPAHVARASDVARPGERRGGLGRPRAVTPDHDHGGAGLGQRLRDGPPDPARAPGDEGDLALQLPGAHAPASCSAPARSDGSPTLSVGTPRAFRRFRPWSTFPGPSSRKRSTPAASIAAIEARQRTGEVSCSTRSSRARAPESTGAAVTLDTTGQAGSRNSTVARCARSPSAAGSISGEWNAPETLSSTTFFAPAS